jgi:hypothetical protein
MAYLPTKGSAVIGANSGGLASAICGAFGSRLNFRRKYNEVQIFVPYGIA